MRDREDAFGHLMFDHLQGRSAEEIVERDDGLFYVGAGPSLYFAGFRDWRSHEQRSMRFVRGRVLDTGCGAGRVLLYLQRRGIDARGIDNSPLAAEVCRLRGVSGVEVRSVSQLDGVGLFDTLLLIWSGFGLLGSRTGARRLLHQMHRLTTTQGRIIATTRDPYVTGDEDDLVYMGTNAQRGRMPGQFRIRIRYRRYCGRWFEYLTVSRDEMTDVIAGTGWKLARFIDGPEGRFAGILDKES